jgi:phage tail sheath protein FI
LAGPDQPEWRQLNVARLFIAVTRWLRAFSVQFVFAPNDVELWVRIRRELSGWLWQRWRDGALAGTTPDAAYYVKCDGETNPPEVRAAGLVVTEVGLAPVQPAEFVSVRLVEPRAGTGP